MNVLKIFKQAFIIVFMTDREKYIQKAYEQAVDMFKDIGLKALFYAGNEDTTPYSDIDLFGIVSPDFDIEENEQMINTHYDERRDSDYGGLEVRFRGIGEDELNGAEPKGVLSKYVDLRGLIPQFDFYKLLWGEKPDFSKYSLKPLTYSEEVEIYSQKIINFLDNLKNGKHIYPIQNFPKEVLRLARVEAEKEHGMKYDPSYKKLVEHLAHKKDHIAHKAMSLRKRQVNHEDILGLEEIVRGYVSQMQEKYAA